MVGVHSPDGRCAIDHGEETLQDTLERLAQSDAALSTDEPGQAARAPTSGPVSQPTRRIHLHRPRNSLEWRYLLPIPLAIFAFWSSWVRFTTWQVLQSDGQQTSATILSSHCGTKGGSSAEISYVANGEEYVTTVDSVGCPPPGGVVTVVYSADDPTVVGGLGSAHLDGMLLAGFWLACGALMLIAGAGAALVERTDAEEEEASTPDGGNSRFPRARPGYRTDEVDEFFSHLAAGTPVEARPVRFHTARVGYDMRSVDGAIDALPRT